MIHDPGEKLDDRPADFSYCGSFAVQMSSIVQDLYLDEPLD